VRVHMDARDNYTPGWKYNHWELKARAACRRRASGLVPACCACLSLIWSV